jgi:P4 family phage/plasmid primase-like protien
VTTPLSFADLLELLGHGSHVAVCHQRPGGIFSSSVVAAADAPAVVETFAGSNVWFGVQPVMGPARENAGRGTAEQVLRLAGLYADLDVKAGGMGSSDAAWAVIATVSEQLGSRPSAVVLSGNGLQPYWPLEHDERITGPDARAMLRRFGRLVAAAAERHGGAVDSVYDLARVLRVPGSQNLKDVDAPKPVIGLTDTGFALAASDVLERLDEWGVHEQAEDREALSAVIAPEGDWAYSERDCHYVRAMVEQWATDSPAARHPWLLSQATRVAAAHRVGCLSPEAHRRAVDALASRFRQLLSGGEVRKEAPGEIADALGWGRARIAVKTDEQALAELGAHTHDNATLTLVGGPAPTQPAPGAPQAAQSAPGPGWTPQVLPGGQASATATSTQHDDTPTNGATALAPQRALSTLERSEDGHAQQLIAAYGELIRFCPEREKWLCWDGMVWRWQPKGGGQVREYAKTIARTFPAGDTAATNHKRRALSAAGTAGCLRQAESDERVVVRLNQLDRHPWHLNTPGGVVNLRTGALEAPDPAMLATKMTTAAPDFDREDPSLQGFLADTFGDNLVLRDYVQRLMGVSLVGQVLEQVLPFAHGQGANGKSTLLEAVMHAVGIGESGYAIAAPAEMLMIRKHSEHPAELAQLAGARLVVCSELDDGQKFAEAKIKQLTGRDSINARFLYGQPFTFSPTHTIWLLGNHRPQASTGGMAFWRRVKLLEFSRIVPPERRDPALGDKLAAAAPAVLAWAIRGAVDYATNGMGEPVDVSTATEAYAADQDTVGRFVEDVVIRTPTNPAARVLVAELRASYERWCSDAGESPASARRLTQELRDRFGIDTTKSSGRRYYTGLTLASTSENDTDLHWSDR